MLSADGNGVVLSVRVIPRARSTKIAGERAGRLLIQTTAPPLDNRANESVCKLLARCLGVAARQVTIEAGERARDKRVRVEGVSSEQVAERLDTTR